jgi:hypothetical protein
MNPTQIHALTTWIKVVATMLFLAGALASLFLWDWRYVVGGVGVAIVSGVLIESLKP